MMKRPLFGWDLPPGVRSTDIPGNRPGDDEIDLNITITRRQLEELARWGDAAFCFHEVGCLLVDAAAHLCPEPPDHPTEPKR